MSHQEAISRYGIDRPDLRIPLELVDIADDMKEVDFKVFSAPANDPKGRVVAMRVPGAGDLSRKDIDELTKFVSIYGAKGLAYIKVNDLTAGLEACNRLSLNLPLKPSGTVCWRKPARKQRFNILWRRQSKHR